MKPVFKCDYCSHTGVESDVAAHERICQDNYNRKHCGTCKNVSFKGITQLACSAGVEIPDKKYMENCDFYERNEGEREVTSFELLFRSMFCGF